MFKARWSFWDIDILGSELQSLKLNFNVSSLSLSYRNLQSAYWG